MSGLMHGCTGCHFCFISERAAALRRAASLANISALTVEWNIQEDCAELNAELVKTCPIKVTTAR